MLNILNVEWPIILHYRVHIVLNNYVEKVFTGEVELLIQSQLDTSHASGAPM